MPNIKIDDRAKELEEINSALSKLKLRKAELEQELIDELDDRSSDTNWASKLIGEEYEITRYAKNFINPDDLRASLGEWLEPDELGKLIRPETKKIVVDPAKVVLAAVNKIKKKGGQVAELIEKVTRKTSDKIKVTKKEVSNGN